MSWLLRPEKPNNSAKENSPVHRRSSPDGSGTGTEFEVEFVVKRTLSKLLCMKTLPRMMLRLPGVTVDPVVYVSVSCWKVPGVIVEFDPLIELRSVEPASKLIE